MLVETTSVPHPTTMSLVAGRLPRPVVGSTSMDRARGTVRRAGLLRLGDQ
jgi:hypothetical protein